MYLLHVAITPVSSPLDDAASGKDVDGGQGAGGQMGKTLIRPGRAGGSEEGCGCVLARLGGGVGCFERTREDIACIYSILLQVRLVAL